MKNDELKNKIVDIIGDVYLVNAPIKDVFKPVFVEKIADVLIDAGIGDIEEGDGDLPCANSVDEMIKMCDGCDFPECRGCEHTYTAVQEIKQLKNREKMDVSHQEKFAKKHGFTPDCTLYYIAEQYKHHAEYERAVFKKAYWDFFTRLNLDEKFRKNFDNLTLGCQIGKFEDMIEQSENELSEEGK